MELILSPTLVKNLDELIMTYVGLANEQSSLFYEMMRVFEIARRRNGARWLVWENVAGALNSNGGDDFREVLGAMAG